jgi:hypothetical protein
MSKTQFSAPSAADHLLMIRLLTEVSPQTREQRPLLPGLAYWQLEQWLVGKTFSAPCPAGSDGTTWTCIITASPSYQGLIVWTTTNQSSFQYGPPYFQYARLMGSCSITTPCRLTQGSVSISGEPILLEN